MPIDNDTAKREFKRMLHEANRAMNDIYDLESEVARLILKYCDEKQLKKRLKGLVELE
jgi:hypothetical protein